MKANDTRVKLSRRLTMIANQVPQGSRVADIGSDHALLPVFLVQHGIVEYAIAGELNEGPYSSALKQVQQTNLEQRISVRHGDGLTVIDPHEVNTVVIAGMGGSTMVNILEQGLDRLQGVRRLIVQPNVGEPALREWFIQHEWFLQDEYILEEDGLIYEILVAVPIDTDELKCSQAELYHSVILDNGTQVDQQLQMLMGPYLIRQGSAVFKSKWLQEIGKREWIIEHLNKSGQQESLDKKSQLEQEINLIQNVLR